jgi:hypothetical protein
MGSRQFDRQTVISATTSKEITVIQGEATDVVGANTYERFTVLSPKNTVSRMFNVIFGWDKDTGQASGYRDCIIDTMINGSSGLTGLGMVKIENDYNKDCQYNQGVGWDSTRLTPSDLAAFSNQINAIRFDDVNGIQVVFFNGMPYGTAMRRYWYLFVEQEVVAR